MSVSVIVSVRASRSDEIEHKGENEYQCERKDESKRKYEIEIE
jgi:hypothetical protein